MSTKNLPEGERPPALGAFRYDGFPRTFRMVDMGVISMINDGECWRAEFEGYEGLMFDLPKPVSDWLLNAGSL